MTALATTGPGKAIGQDATLQVGTQLALGVRRDALIGDDREPIAPWRARHVQGLHCREELVETQDTEHSGAAEHGVVDGIAARERARVGRGGPGPLGVPARLDHDHRLGARGGPRRGDELAGGGNRLDIQQDGPGVRLVGEVIEHVAKIHIGHIPQRDQVRKAGAARARPIEHRGHHWR